MNVKLIGKHEKDSRACRDGLALTLNELMGQDKSIVYVDCDLMGCINTKQLAKNYPDRAFEAGIAEGNAAGISAGLAATGKKVFFHSFGTFSSRRCYDQIYMSAAYAGLSVRVLGSDAGVTAAFNGGTHMPLEDAAMYLSIPTATVIDPADYDQLASVTRGLVNVEGVSFTRFVRKDVIQVYGEGSEFEIGKGAVLKDGMDAVIFACGIMVTKALDAAATLEEEGISAAVVDLFTVKPLDAELVLSYAKKTGAEKLYISAHSAAEVTLANWKDRRAMPSTPASSGTSARAGPKNRPSATAATPQRPMKPSAFRVIAG